jgi:hypothetical protein
MSSIFYSLIFGIAALAGFESVILKPSLYAYAVAYFFLISILGGVFFGKGAARREIFLEKILLFFLFLAGSMVLLLYFESGFVRHLFAIAASAVLIMRSTFAPGNGRGAIFAAIFTSFLAFIGAAALYGLNLFFSMSIWPLSVGALLLSALLVYECAIAEEGGANPPMIIFGAIFASQIFLALSFLPNSFYAAASIFTIFLFLYEEMLFRRDLEKAAKLRLLFSSFFLVAVIFVTAKWT